MASPGVTKTMMAGAMKELMACRPLEKISVGEIVAQCNLNRNSFYYHFKDKFDLVNWIFYTEFAAEMQAGEDETAWDSIERMLRFFYSNKAFYVNALSVSGQNSFAEYFMDILKAILLARAEGHFEDREDREFCAQLLADTFLVTIIRWLRTGAKMPPEKLAALLERVVTGAAMKLTQGLEEA